MDRPGEKKTREITAMAGELPRSPNVFHPTKSSAVGSRNSLAQEWRREANRRCVHFFGEKTLGLRDGHIRTGNRIRSADLPGNPLLGSQHAEEVTSTSRFNFDLVMLINLLEHVGAELEKGVISEAHRLVKRDGLLIVSVPSVNRPLGPNHFRHDTCIYTEMNASISTHMESMEIRVPGDSAGMSFTSSCNRQTD